MANDSLSQMPGASELDLRQVSSSMQEYIRAATVEARQAALESANRNGVMQRIFPTQYERETRRLQARTARQLGEAQLELLDLFAQTQLEIARKQADALIATQGMHMQVELARFAAERINDLNSTINTSRKRFMPEIEEQLQLIEKYKDYPELFEGVDSSVRHQIQVYFNTMKALLDGFDQSLRNRIGEVQK